MVESFFPGALLGHTYALEDGTRVRLRLARGSDLLAIRALLEHTGGDESAARLVHFDLRREYVLCATALVDGRETLLGLGRVELDGGGAEPELLLSQRAGEEVQRLLRAALLTSAETFARSRAA